LEELTDDGISIEDIAPIFARYRKLRQQGVQFATGFVVWIEGLHAETIDSPDDPDSDDADSRIDRDAGEALYDLSREVLEYTWEPEFDTRDRLPVVWRGLVNPRADHLIRALQTKGEELARGRQTARLA
jgi:hypothetical protein